MIETNGINKIAIKKTTWQSNLPILFYFFEQQQKNWRHILVKWNGCDVYKGFEKTYLRSSESMYNPANSCGNKMRIIFILCSDKKKDNEVNECNHLSYFNLLLLWIFLRFFRVNIRYSTRSQKWMHVTSQNVNHKINWSDNWM